MSTAGRIDTHHHVTYDFWREAVSRHAPDERFEVPSWSPETAIALMDETECRASVLSVSAPGTWFGDAAEANELARRVNDATGEIVKDRPDRFGMFASLPVPDVDGALEETRRAYDELHADGVVLLASTRGQYLGDPALDPLLEELDRRSAVAFIHPGPPGAVAPGIPPFMADFLLDTVRAAMSLVLHDVPGRFPNIRFILSHGGGFLPYVPARLAHSLSILGMPPERMEQFRTFWFDTALTPGPTSLPSLLAFAKPEQITYGSDCPYAPDGTIASFARALDAFEMAPELRVAINHGNAGALFPRFARAE